MPRQYYVGDEPIPGYRLSKLIGKGRFGHVWKATAQGGTEVALKIIAIDSDENYKKVRRLRLIVHVKNPHLVPIVAIWLRDGEGHIVSDEEIDSGAGSAGRDSEILIANGLGEKSLADRLGECLEASMEGIPPEELLDYMEYAARGVDHLNQLNYDVGSGPIGIPHCNVKPSNLILVGGACQVGDYGLVHVLGLKQKSPGNTPFYLAPELFLQSKPSPATDQYSLAICYVQLRTGSLPIQANSPAGVVAAHVRGMLDLSRLPEPERLVIQRATALDPGHRFPRSLDMVRALRQALNPNVSEPPVSMPAHDPAPKRRDSILVLEKGLEIVPGYRLIRMIGKGGYGEVWESTAPGNLPIALKVVRNLKEKTGRQEFKALQLIRNVNHIHLLGLHAYWLLDEHGNLIPDEQVGAPDAQPPATLVLASRLAEKNLLQRLKECQREGKKGIPADELIEYTRQSALAIDHLNAPKHPLGDKKVSIQHRDIKPENILLAGDVAIVADFGLARLLEGSNARVSTDSVGLTLLYAAPEMLSGGISSWSDQYSLAITYFHVRTGEIPFPRNLNPYAIIQAHVKGQLDLSLMPELERAVIARATALKPEGRWPSCKAMVKALSRALAEEGGLTPDMQRSMANIDIAPDSDSELPGHGPSPSGTHESATENNPALVQRPPRPQPALVQELEAEDEEVSDLLASAETSDSSPHRVTPVPGPSGLYAAGPTSRPSSGATPIAPLEQDFPLVPERSGAWATVKLIIMVLLAVAAGGVAAVKIKDVLFPSPEKVLADVRALVGEGRYPEALTKLRDTTVLDTAIKNQERENILNGWRDVIQAKYRDHQYDGVVADADLFLPWNDDPKVKSWRKDAQEQQQLAKVQQQLAQAQQAIDGGQYAEAWKQLKTCDPEKAEAKKGELHAKWLAAARRFRDAKQFRPAVAAYSELLDAFPGDSEAKDERTTAQREVVRLDVDDMTKAANFEGALKLAHDHPDVVPEDTVKGLKQRLAGQRFEKAKKETNPQTQVALLTKLVDEFDYAPAADFLKDLRGGGAQKQLRDQLVDGEKLLAAGPQQAKQALQVFETILQHSDINTDALAGVRRDAWLDKARAQARLADWKGMDASLKQFGAAPDDRRAAYVKLLQLLAVDAGAGSADKLALLIDLNKDIARVDDWEHKQYVQVKQRVLKDTVSTVLQRPDALKIIDSVLAIAPQDVPALLVKADLQYRQPDFKGLQVTLDSVKKLPKTVKLLAEQQAEVDALAALVQAKSGAADAFERLRRMLTVPLPPLKPVRTRDLCDALVSLAKTDPQVNLGTVRQTLSDVAKATKDKDLEQRARRGQREVASIDVQRQLDRTAQVPDWAQLALACREAEPTEWVRVALAECLLEQNVTVAPEDLKQARTALDAKDTAKTGAYALYVRALLSRAEAKLDQAAKQIVDAYRVEPPPILKGFRREHAVTILGTAIEQLRGPASNPRELARNPLLPPFKSADAAKQALEWADKAQQLWMQEKHPDLVDLQVVKVLALGHQTKPDLPGAALQADALLTKLGGDELRNLRPSLLLLKARGLAASPQTHTKALEAYADLAEQLEKKSVSDSLALQIHQQVVGEAFKLADKPPASTALPVKRQLARLHAALGQALIENPTAAWPFKDGRQQAITEFDTACQLDRQRADYCVRRGFARSLLPNPSLNLIKQDADEALKRDKDWPSAHGLLGYVYLLNARKAGDLDDRIQQLTKAVSVVGEAVALCRTSKDDGAALPVLLTNYSTASLELGNALPKKYREPRFTAALKAAQEAATKFPDRRYPENAFRAMGNACEDLASQVGRNPEANYAAAVQAFTDAINTPRLDQAQPWIDRGRCLYKSVAEGPAPLKRLDEAESDLHEALQRQAPRPEERMQAHYWLAKVRLKKDDYPQAQKYFVETIKEAKALSSAAWSAYALEWAGLAKGEGLRIKKKDAKLSKDLLDSAVESAASVLKERAAATQPYEQVERADAGLLLAGLYRAQAKPVDALTAYLAAVPSSKLQQLEHLDRSQLAKLPLVYFKVLLERAAYIDHEVRVSPSGAVRKAITQDVQEVLRRDLTQAVKIEQAIPGETIADGDRMRACGLSGTVHFNLSSGAALPASTRSQYRATALEHLKEGVGYKQAADDGDFWAWNFFLGELYTMGQKRPEALRHMRIAKDNAPDQFKPALQKKIEALMP